MKQDRARVCPVTSVQQSGSNNIIVRLYLATSTDDALQMNQVRQQRYLER